MNSQNGAPIAPVKPFATTQRATTFLPDAPLAPWQGWLYGLTRAQWVGMPLIRWLYLLPIALAALWLAGWLPGGWLVSLCWLTATAVLWAMVRVSARRHFTTFRATPTPPPSPHILLPAEKRPVYITGALSVEAKSRIFTALPGFYRSFATREHAIIGRVQPRRIAALATWPEDEIGLWYAFFMPSQIVDITPGQQLIGRQWLPALATTFRPAPIARRRTPGLATLYLAFPDPNDHTAVLADLLADSPPAPPNE